MREWIGQVLSSLQEGISGVRIIQAYGDESTQIERLKESIIWMQLTSAKNIYLFSIY